MSGPDTAPVAAALEAYAIAANATDRSIDDLIVDLIADLQHYSPMPEYGPARETRCQHYPAGLPVGDQPCPYCYPREVTS